jgi:hydrogenase expression/formation protein HypE
MALSRRRINDETLPIGKLPSDLLERYLPRIKLDDPRVLVGPGIGSDAALLDPAHQLVVATSDPVTFATEDIGWYAVNINANDIACLGGRPLWFLATILLPEGTTLSTSERIFDDLVKACDSLGVTLIGGHTEVTQAVERPILAGTMLGEVATGKAILPGGAKPHDHLLLTKGIALEGTALLAQEAATMLRTNGLTDADLQEARNLLCDPGISVVRDALTAYEAGGVNAMHDPTEGGVATGILEMAQAARVGVEVRTTAIPILPACKKICQTLRLNPLGLLASGSLLLSVSPRGVEGVRQALSQAAIPVTEIGRVTNASEGTKLLTAHGHMPIPRFDRDEFARFLTESPS